jgi:hypothetical protein
MAIKTGSAQIAICRIVSTNTFSVGGHFSMNTARPPKKQGNKRRRIGILEYRKVGIDEGGHIIPVFHPSIIPFFPALFPSDDIAGEPP